MQTPRLVEIAITSRCNLRCKYCSHFSSFDKENEEEIATDEWIRFFEELGRNSVMSVVLTGGEPFIRSDLQEIIQGIVKNRMRFCILSNGTLITDKIAKMIASTGRCDYIQVSLDGATAESHDACCGSGSFAKALKGLHILRSHNIPVIGRVTLHRYNVNELEQIAHFLLDDLNLDSFGINSASYFGLCRQNKTDICLSNKDRTDAMATLLELSKQYPGRIGAAAGPLAEVNSFIKMEGAYRSQQAPFNDGGYLTACGCIWSTCAVNSNGTIIPCILLPHLALGKINRDEIKTVWNSHPILTAMRQRFNISLKSFKFCEGCNYLEYCTGNCPALTYTITGILDHPCPDTCFRKFLADGGKIPIFERSVTEK